MVVNVCIPTRERGNETIQFTSHSTLSNDAVAEPTVQEKQTVKFLLEHLINNYSYWQQAEQND